MVNWERGMSSNKQMLLIAVSNHLIYNLQSSTVGNHVNPNSGGQVNLHYLFHWLRFLHRFYRVMDCPPTITLQSFSYLGKQRTRVKRRHLWAYSKHDRITLTYSYSVLVSNAWILALGTFWLTFESLTKFSYYVMAIIHWHTHSRTVREHGPHWCCINSTFDW